MWVVRSPTGKFYLHREPRDWRIDRSPGIGDHESQEDAHRSLQKQKWMPPDAAEEELQQVRREMVMLEARATCMAATLHEIAGGKLGKKEAVELARRALDAMDAGKKEPPTTKGAGDGERA